MRIAAPVKPRASSGRAALTLLVAVLLLVVVIAAGVVIVQSTQRIAPVEVPDHLRPRPPDVGLQRLRRSLRHRLRRSEERFERFRGFVDEPTPEQDSLARVVLTELAGIRTELAAMDSLAELEDQRELHRRRGPVFARYRELVSTISNYGRTVTARGLPELDSLDRELERLLRE